jgi:hypothetical protein
LEDSMDMSTPGVLRRSMPSNGRASVERRMESSATPFVGLLDSEVNVDIIVNGFGTLQRRSQRD